MTDVDAAMAEISVVPEPSKSYLNPRQLADYRSQRETCLRWLLTFGKDPLRAEGYALGTVKPRAYRMDHCYRWAWQQEGGYTSNLTHEHADGWMAHLAQQDVSSTHKTNCQKAVKMLFKWRHHAEGRAIWSPEIVFSEDSSVQPRDFLTNEERHLIRDAALEYGSVPAYKNLTPTERSRWKAYLAQRFEKPKDEVKPADWDRANGWKIPSLVWASLDAGLRPIEVNRAVVSWVDVDNGVLRIPKEESSKNRENWVVSLRERTAEMLARWLQERGNYTDYDGRDEVWLTQKGNPFDNQNLRYLLHRLCELADIPYENRQMGWYAIRHSLGTYMTREEDLAATRVQLRHTSVETTMKYDQAPVEDRRSALERMG